MKQKTIQMERKRQNRSSSDFAHLFLLSLDKDLLGTSTKVGRIRQARRCVCIVISGIHVKKHSSFVSNLDECGS